MPLAKLQFKPGINKESTIYANEGGWYDSEKIRFRSGYPEKIGGWQSISNPNTYTFKGVARDLWAWVTLAFSNLSGFGTNQKYYIESGGQYNDVTPVLSTGTLGSNPFTTTSGSKLVTVNSPAHGLSPSTWVTYSGAATFNGVTLNGSYEVITVIDGNTYTIIDGTASGTGSGGGAAVAYTYQIPAGNAVYTQGTGWGAGTWGGVVAGGTNTGWGSASVIGVAQQLTLWNSDNYGQNLFASPRGGAIYYWQTPASVSSFPPMVTLSSLVTVGNAPSAPSLAAAQTAIPGQTLQLVSSDIERFVIAFGATPFNSNSASSFNPLLVRWSDQGNEFDWYPATTNQAGDYILSGGSTILGAQYARQEILIWTDSAIYSMQYIGPPYVWKFTLLMNNISMISPNAFGTSNNVTYWMGRDRFYMYNGTVQTLPCTLRQFVFTNINQNQAYQVVTGTNEGYNEVWWFYPSFNSQVNDSYVVYNYLENTWYHGTINRTFWLDVGIRTYPMGVFSVQNTYLSTAITSTATSIAVLNGYSYPNSGVIQIDSEQISYTGISNNTFTGCTRGFNSTTAASHVQYSAVNYYIPNQIMYHENGTDDGSLPTVVPFDSYVQSSDFDIGDGQNFEYVWRMLPDVNFNASTSNNPQVTITLKPRNSSGSQYAVEPPNAVVSGDNYTNQRIYTVNQFTPIVYTRVRGRQMAFKIESNSLGVAWQLGAPRIDTRPDGRRA